MQNDTPIIKTAPFTVVREIILPESKYRRFQADLLAEAPFIAARTQLTGYSKKSGRFRCLLVTTRRRQDGILVDSEGYAYTRYAAYVRDKRELDLAGVPRDNLDLKAVSGDHFSFPQERESKSTYRLKMAAPSAARPPPPSAAMAQA